MSKIAHPIAPQNASITNEEKNTNGMIFFIGSLLPQRSNFSNIGEGLNTISLEECVPMGTPR